MSLNTFLHLKKLTFFTLSCVFMFMGGIQPPQTIYSQDSSKASINSLQNSLRSLINNAAGKGTKVSALVYSLDTKETLFDYNSHVPLTPASTTKLFSTYTAFHIMGGNYSVPTIVATDGAEPQDGVLNGDIYIIGKGDALLTIADIEELADKIEQAGIKKINGNIYADGTYFDKIVHRHIYSGDGEVVEPLPPITALSYYRNSMTVMVSGGNPLRVQTIPPSDAFLTTVKQGVVAQAPVNKGARKINSAPTIRRNVPKTKVKGIVKGNKNSGRVMRKGKVVPKKKGRKHSFIDIPDELWKDRYGDAPRNRKAPVRKGRVRGGVGIQSSILPDGMQHFTVSGSLGAGSAVSKHFSIVKPELAIAGSLANRLKSGGVEITGKIGLKKAPDNARTLGESRRALTEMINIVNKNSDNFLAEQTFKMVGAFSGGQENTGATAVKTMKEELAELGVNTEGLCVNDGSGLCRKNLISAKTEVDLLVKASQSNFADQFSNSLSIAGVDGTLRRRMIGTRAQNNLHAKTGTLRNVSALAGYVTTKDGEKLCFAIIWNGGNVGSYKMTENMIGSTLADFSRGTTTSIGAIDTDDEVSE